MRQNLVTIVNVDDYIRERKKGGAKKIIWGSNSGLQAFFNLVSSFVKVNRVKQLHGIRFMGIKHYLR